MTATPTAATPTQTPEELARSIIPPNYRAETARTGVMPSMDMVLSSRCAGSLRDAIAAAIRQHSEAQRAENERLTAKLDACITVKDRAFTAATTAEAALAAMTAERDALATEAESLRYDAGMARTLRDKAGKVCGAAQRLVYEMRNHVPSDAALPHASLELQAIRRHYDALSAALAKEAADGR